MIRLRTLLIQLGAVALLILGSSRAAATVSCTLTGTMSLESQDSYYCDTDILGASACSGWKEVDLDVKTVPLKYMWMSVNLEYGTTDANGAYSLTFQLSGTQCAGQTVSLVAHFARVHEADAAPHAPAPRFRFFITDFDGVPPVPSNTIWTKSWSVPLTGPTTTKSVTWGRGSTQTSTRLANLYYTANSMISEVKGWSSNLESQFTASCCSPANGLRIAIEDGVLQGGGLMTSFTDPAVLIGYDAYGIGGVIRAEIGHATHAYTHHKQRDMTCYSSKFDHQDCTTDGRCAWPTCEYGSAATVEGFSTFFAARSIMGSNTNDKVWECTCWDGALDFGGNGVVDNWDICSEQAIATDPDTGQPYKDWVFMCQSGDVGAGFYYIGDYRVNDDLDCADLRYNGGCNCVEGGGPPTGCGYSWDRDNGWRNDIQVARFLWDMIDGTTDNGADDADFGITDIVGVLEGMPCLGSLGGQDGSCEEDAPPPGGQCTPTNDGDTSPSGTGTRDSVNLWDIAAALPGSQGSERTLNCVQGAPD